MGRVSWTIDSDGEDGGDGHYDGNGDVVEYDCGDDDDQITMAACEGAYGGNDPIYCLFTITPPITNLAPSVQRDPRTANLKRTNLHNG